ncbi:MAG TPA: UDP-N-acetylmuramoyl-L-alanine--D-glutamate ligase [Thermoanaerobaculia bacterium]|nr:UDP-N-acetylmuramoyl-L-alanine--D-glutamate ligase [Thermoanaerobaculia bacterium]
MQVPWGDGDWRRVLVYGLGLSGQAAARFLRARGVEVVGVDRRGAAEIGAPDLERDPGVELALGREPESLPEGLEGVVLSPGVPLDRPLLAAARRRGLPVIAEVELAFPFLNGPVVGITGSNGKSTTTALTGALLAAAGRRVEVCGNIGRPLTACVDGPMERVFVVELSSFQLETTDTFRPRAAALLNISADHLDRHADLRRYAAAKERIFLRQRADDVAVLNADDPEVARVVVAARRRQFARLAPVADGCFADGERVVEVEPDTPPRELFRRGELALDGLHNLENAMAAALLARALGAGSEAIRAGLRGFRGLPHRLERVAETGGVVFYDDSKGTNVAATARSLEDFADGSVHLILGGRNKGADLRALREVVTRKAARAYLIGEAAAELEAALAGTVPLEPAGTLDRAVALAGSRATAGEAVVLSPACASFDQFRDFNDRGDQFQRFVREFCLNG